MTRARARKPASIASRARALHAAALAEGRQLSDAEIARQLSTPRHPVSRQAVREARLATPGARPGRKVNWPARVARLRRELAEAERELAESVAR